MAFVTISNEKGFQLECIVFPKTFELYKKYLLNDSVIMLEGKLDNKNEKMIIIIQTITPAKTLIT